MKKCSHTTPAEYDKQEMDWGTLSWFTSRELGNSEHLTVGRSVVKAGCQNPLHIHPNCEEVLYVLQGSIRHSIEGGKTVAMKAGDTIVIPAGIPHNAQNIGPEEAVLWLCFSSADREFVLAPDH